MQGLKILVISMGVMIFLATTALVVLVLKKNRTIHPNPAISTIKGNYINSYVVGNNIMVVSKDANGKTTLTLVNPATMLPMQQLVISP